MKCNFVIENIAVKPKISQLQDYYIRVSDILPLSEDVTFYNLDNEYGI